MSKSFVFLSLACAGALAYADNAQWQSPWFKGIGANATSTSSMDATNGSWTFPTEGATVTDHVLDLDLDADDQALFTVGATAAGDTNTLQRINIKGVFTPVKPADLVAGSAMDSGNAQVGFAVVKVSDTPSYQYYAWVGATGGAAAVNDWVALTGVTPTVDGETDLQIDIGRWNSAAAPTATFWVKNGGNYVALVNGSSASALTISSTAGVAANKVVASVACTGSGTISAVDGSVQYGVAKYVLGDLEYKYPTADAAIEAAAGVVGTKPEVILTRDADGTVAVDPTVAVNNNGHTATLDPGSSTDPVEVKLPAASVASGSGVYVLDVSTTAEASKFQITTTDASKEVAVSKNAQNKLVATVQTSTAILNAVVPTGAKALTYDMTKYRAFLNTYAHSSYTMANTMANYIQADLETVPENKNGLPLWQDYVLGIQPETSVKPAAMTGSDTDADNITVSIPGLSTATPSGDYKVSYKVGDSTFDSPSAIKVPVATDSYDVKIVLE